MVAKWALVGSLLPSWPLPRLRCFRCGLVPVYCLQRLRVACQFLGSTTGTPWADLLIREVCFSVWVSALLPPRLGELGAAGATNLQLWRRPWCIGSGLVCWGEQKSKYSHCHHICIQQKHTGQPWPLFALALTLRCLRQRGVRCRIATKDPAVSTAG